MLMLWLLIFRAIRTIMRYIIIA